MTKLPDLPTIPRYLQSSGSFVIQHNGTFADGKLKSNWFVVPGSGTGELRNLRGEGTYTNEGGEPRTAYTFDYEFD